MFIEKSEASPASLGANPELQALSPAASRRTQRLTDTEAAMIQAEGVTETGSQMSRRVSRGVSDHQDDLAEPELDDDFPDGGLQAWLVVLGAWCVSFCTYGWINSVGTFQEYYQTGPLKDYSASQIAWIPSMQIFLMSFLAPFTGRLFDTYGPRFLLLAGSFLHVFGLMMASLSSQYYQFMLSQGICSAVGVSASFLAVIGCVSSWFRKRRGTAFGLFATGSSLGGVVFPIMLSNLINTVGYGWAMRIAAFMICALLVIANLTVKSRHTPRRKSLSPELLTRPFREKTFLFLLIGLGLVPFGLYTPIDFMPTVAKVEGVRQLLAQNLIAFYNAASLVGRAGSGLLADKFGLFNIFALACYGAGVLILALWIPGGSNDAATVAFSVLFGLFSGAYIALLGALVGKISRIEEVGYRNGVSQLAGAFGGLVTSPIAGVILQGSGGQTGLKVFAGVFMMAGTTAIVAARLSRTGFRLLVAF